MNDYRNRRAFTLMELLVVIVIITVLATMVLFAVYGALESAKRARTQTQVMRLHEMVLAKWEAYKTLAVRLRIPPSARGNAMDIAAARLLAIRDLQRMELPDRIADLNEFPAVIPVPTTAPPLRLDPPALWRAYRRRAGYVGNSIVPPATWSASHQGAECLYLIVAQTRDGDTSGLDFLKETEIGDTDFDGMPEILDAWGRPIEFLRWAPGFSISTGPDLKWGLSASDNIDLRGESGSDDELVSDIHIPDGRLSPDPFDPLQVDDNLRVNRGVPKRRTFALIPLIFSAGPDNKYDITTDGATSISYTNPPRPPGPFMADDPFYVISPLSAGDPEKQIGTPWDTNGDGELNSIDNITNHLIVE
ncbi:MAG TPA: type II secretion system protein [Pirellulaceae bacterium]|jgi:prepilin-type N-terminal cleavage/methylation domain-containing protein|nr:type II secretion system protein [Pirellulaceae bacterium]